MNKILITLVAIVFFGCAREHAQGKMELRLPENATDAERAFGRIFSDAARDKNADALVRITHADSAHSYPSLQQEFYKALLGREIVALEVTRVDPKLYTERVEGENRVRESLPVRWHVVARHSKEWDIVTEMWAGELGGEIRLTTTYGINEVPNPESCSHAKP